MKKLVNLSLEERFERLDVLSSDQIAKIYGGTEGDIVFNPTIKNTPAPTITFPPISIPKTRPISLSIGPGGGGVVATIKF